MNKKLRLNAGIGMTIGAVLAAIISIIVNVVTGSSDIWSWSIPIGVAAGLAVGAGRAASKSKDQ